MDVIVRANEEKFKDDDMICDALMEIIQDKLDEREKQILERAEKQGMERGMQEGIEQGMQQGMEQGIQQGMEQGVQLYLKMIQLGRQEDAMKAIEDAEYRKKLFEEFGLQ